MLGTKIIREAERCLADARDFEAIFDETAGTPGSGTGQSLTPSGSESLRAGGVGARTEERSEAERRARRVSHAG